MKAKAVAVLRERGLRPDECRWAEPQCCERQFKQPEERKTDTMKNYILHPLPPVETQTLMGAAALGWAALFACCSYVPLAAPTIGARATPEACSTGWAHRAVPRRNTSC